MCGLSLGGKSEEKFQGQILDTPAFRNRITEKETERGQPGRQKEIHKRVEFGIQGQRFLVGGRGQLCLVLLRGQLGPETWLLDWPSWNLAENIVGEFGLIHIGKSRDLDLTSMS